LKTVRRCGLKLPLNDFVAREAKSSTPLAHDDLLGLIPAWIATRDDLNLAEFTNINAAQTQSIWRKFSTDQLLDDLRLRRLHKAMFGNVWAWAGQYRTRNLNLGIDFSNVSLEVRNLLEDAKYWFNSNAADQIEADACAFHHRLVAIHPFANGNGRHARFYADLLLQSKGLPAFTWGGVSLSDASEKRTAYIHALQLADRGDTRALQAFVRS
jgi:Fic-DOC domain mobile mystery protein B